MNFKKSLTEEELGVILAPQLRLFLSVDVVGSTAFKHRKALDGESKPWLKFIHGFYTGFPEMCWRRVTEVQAEAPPKTLLAKPYLWKALGDELIFHGDGISSRFQPPPDFAARLADAQREIGKIYDITYPELAVPADSGEMADEVEELLKEVIKAKPPPKKSLGRPPKPKKPDSSHDDR